MIFSNSCINIDSHHSHLIVHFYNKIVIKMFDFLLSIPNNFSLTLIYFQIYLFIVFFFLIVIILFWRTLFFNVDAIFRIKLFVIHLKFLFWKIFVWKMMHWNLDAHQTMIGKRDRYPVFTRSDNSRILTMPILDGLLYAPRSFGPASDEGFHNQTSWQMWVFPALEPSNEWSGWLHVGETRFEGASTPRRIRSLISC